MPFKDKSKKAEYDIVRRKSHPLDPARVLSNARQRLYGISSDRFQEMLEEQEGKCVLCLRVFSEELKNYVDHDHVTGNVRGILCNRCNIRLAAVEDAMWLERAKRYLEKFL
jgi:hypothetical protein